MKFIGKIKALAEEVPMSIGYKLNNGLATLSDEEEVLSRDDPRSAHIFAKEIPGSNKEKLQEITCKDPQWAYYFARDILGADKEKCCEAACKDPEEAYYFAKYVPGANIEKCKEAAYKDHYWKCRIMEMLLEKEYLFTETHYN